MIWDGVHEQPKKKEKASPAVDMLKEIIDLISELQNPVKLDHSKMVLMNPRNALGFLCSPECDIVHPMSSLQSFAKSTGNIPHAVVFKKGD